MATVHVIGAGLAGLSAALHLIEKGEAVTLYEAAPQAGGRCRSFFDDQLGRVIDNGNHLLLGANAATRAYLASAGGLSAMTEVAPATFPFLDIKRNEIWTIRPNAGRIPWWIFSPERRVPGTRARDYLSALRLLRPAASTSVADYVDARTPIAERFWTPLVVSVMNASLKDAAALPMAAMLRETFGRGEAACRPFLALQGLSAALVDPALARFASLGGTYRAGWRLVQIEREIGRVAAMQFDNGRVDLAIDDCVVLAVPHYAAAELLPGLTVPIGTRAIVNAHFRLRGTARLPGGGPLLGLINATAQWLIARGDIVSVTVSAADALADMPVETLLRTLWNDVARALQWPQTPLSPGRIVKERRATFAQTPENQRRRPGFATAWRNLFLAGDWTDTGLPATIESAVRSGMAAGRAARASMGRPL